MALRRGRLDAQSPARRLAVSEPRPAGSPPRTRRRATCSSRAARRSTRSTTTISASSRRCWHSARRRAEATSRRGSVWARGRGACRAAGLSRSAGFTRSCSSPSSTTGRGSGRAPRMRRTRRSAGTSSSSSSCRAQEARAASTRSSRVRPAASSCAICSRRTSRPTRPPAETDEQRLERRLDEVRREIAALGFEAIVGARRSEAMRRPTRSLVRAKRANERGWPARRARSRSGRSRSASDAAKPLAPAFADADSILARLVRRADRLLRDRARGEVARHARLTSIRRERGSDWRAGESARPVAHVDPPQPEATSSATSLLLLADERAGLGDRNRQLGAMDGLWRRLDCLEWIAGPRVDGASTRARSRSTRPRRPPDREP